MVPAVPVALMGVMHSFYDSGSTLAPVLVVDLGDEPVDRIVLRWHGEGSEDQDYALYAFDHSHKHKSIKDIYKLFGKGQADGYLIYRGTTNPCDGPDGGCPQHPLPMSGTITASFRPIGRRPTVTTVCVRARNW